MLVEEWADRAEERVRPLNEREVVRTRHKHELCARDPRRDEARSRFGDRVVRPILRFDGPSGDTPYHVRSESYSRTFEVRDGEVREVDAYSTIIEGVPASADRPTKRAVPGPAILVCVAAAVLALAQRKV